MLHAPRAAHSRTSGIRSHRWISGGSSFMRGSFLLHKRMHFPGAVRPARPARWAAENSLSVSVTRFCIPVETFIRLMRESPESMTHVTPGTVSDVSATAEEIITRRTFSFGSERTAFCASNEMLE